MGTSPQYDHHLGLTFQVDDLPITAVDTSVGTPPARAPRGQWEEEEVPRLGLSHPIGDHIEVLAQQPLAEEECRSARCPSYSLGTRVCFRDTGTLATLAASPTHWLIPNSHGGLGTVWDSMNGESPKKRPPPLGIEHPWMLWKRPGVQDLALLCQG